MKTERLIFLRQKQAKIDKVKCPFIFRALEVYTIDREKGYLGLFEWGMRFVDTLVMNDGTIEFKVLDEDDLPLVFSWINQPEIARWWVDKDLDWDAFSARYLGKLEGNIEFPFIVFIEGVPIGYIEYYVANKFGGGWWPNEPDGVYGIDVFIGEQDKVGRGYGSLFIRLFLCFLFSKPEIKKIIIDPAVDNHRAIRCYQKVGFEPVGVQVTPLGKVMLMHLYNPTYVNQGEIEVVVLEHEFV